jgi:hypothetical protein
MRQKLNEFSFPEIFRMAGATVDHQRLYRQSLTPKVASIRLTSASGFKSFS